jgi:hypothetical protein
MVLISLTIAACWSSRCPDPSANWIICTGAAAGKHAPTRAQRPAPGHRSGAPTDSQRMRVHCHPDPLGGRAWAAGWRRGEQPPSTSTGAGGDHGMGHDQN